MCKIMIVEDNHHIRTLFKNILKNRGYDIVDVADGGKAIKIYDSMDQKPEIIVVDYRLPTLNGLELTQEILTRDPSSRILMITGDPRINQNVETEYGIKLRAKPIHMDDFVSEIDLLNDEVESNRDEDVLPKTSGRNRYFVQENEIGYELKIYGE